MNRTHTRTQGFTLIELLVVMAIIAVLAGILIPSYAAAQKRPYDVATLQCIKAIKTAQITYAAEHSGNPANSVAQLNDSDVNEQCRNIQVHHFDATGLTPGGTGDRLFSNSNGDALFLAWSGSGSNIYEVNYSAAEHIKPIRWN